MNYKLILVIILLAISLAGVGKLYISTSNQLALAEEKNTALILTMEAAAEERSKLTKKMTDNRLELRRKEVELEDLKRGSNAALKKPKLMEKLIQKSYEERERRLECMTGGLCYDQQL